MKKRLFKNVAIDDRHVGISKVALTTSGVMVYGEIWLENSSCKWYCEDHKYNNEYGMFPYVESVLEEIELPSEEDLEDRAIYLGYKHTSNENRIFRQGAYEIINKTIGA